MHPIKKKENKCKPLPPTDEKKKVGVTRLHMEEDSAKMNHQGAESLSGSTHSLIDFNRAGTPLAEIVSEPDMRAGIEAAEYGRELQRVRVAQQVSRFGLCLVSRGSNPSFGDNFCSLLEFTPHVLVTLVSL